MLTKEIETRTMELMGGLLAALQQAHRIEPTDVKKFNYTVDGCEALLNYDGKTYKITISAASV